jgi:hypothetical protein
MKFGAGAIGFCWHDVVADRTAISRKQRRVGVLDGEGNAMVDTKLFEILLFNPAVSVYSDTRGITRLW